MAGMQIRYIGPYRAVQIAATNQVVEQGQTVMVPKDVGESLLRQGTWKRPARRRTTKSDEEQQA